MASLKALVPRVVKIQTRDRTDTAGDGSRWWKQDRYIDFKSRHALRWLGRNWLTWQYQKFPGSYLADARDVVRLLQELSSARLVPPLTDRSRVFEGGANLGRNLLAIQNAYRCEVVGMDLSPRAVEYARERVWKDRSRWEIFEGDVLTSPWFSSVPDKAFDLALTRWHLIHIPASSAKRAYVEQLRRISRTLLVLEPPPLRPGGSIEYHHSGDYVLSRDDWASTYDLKVFEPKERMENTAVYYAR
jgi:SAM-dependent methyltransferase